MIDSFSFDGKQIQFSSGQTIAAALWAAGIRSWRTTRIAGKPRGIYCNIGVCFDCLIQLDGEPNQRACLAVARAGATVQTQVGTGHG